MTWLTTALALLKLLGALVEWANATRAANETRAAALARIFTDAQKTIGAANSARAAADKRNADPGKLRDDDGFKRPD